MSSTGDTKPESKMAGIMKANAPSIACCWLAQTEEMNSPTPTKESRAIKEEKMKRKNEPVNGMAKKKTAASVMADCRISAMKSGGTVLPTSPAPVLWPPTAKSASG